MDNALEIVNAVGSMLKGSGSSDGLGGGWGIWILIILFFIMFAGGGVFGGYNNGVVEGLSNEFLYTNLNNQTNQGFTQVANQNFNIAQELCAGFAGVNSSINNGINSVNSGLAENRFASQQCCCETNRNIDALRYDAARNTCDIITASNANTQKIIDTMQADKIDQLRTQLQLTQNELSNNYQTQTLVNQLRPFPTPAYITCSPYTASSIYGYSGTCACAV
jgi:DNA-binding transcriptional regulator YiaG